LELGAIPTAYAGSIKIGFEASKPIGGEDPIVAALDATDRTARVQMRIAGKAGSIVRNRCIAETAPYIRAEIEAGPIRHP
jgi:hypothetical protein